MQNEADRKHSPIPSEHKMASAPPSYGCAVDAPISCAPAIERHENIRRRLGGPQRQESSLGALTFVGEDTF